MPIAVEVRHISASLGGQAHRFDMVVASGAENDCFVQGSPREVAVVIDRHSGQEEDLHRADLPAFAGRGECNAVRSSFL